MGSTLSINTVTKLLVDAGEACRTFHDAEVREVSASRVECDEIWAFCYAKAKNVAYASAAPDSAGDVWDGYRPGLQTCCLLAR